MIVVIDEDDNPQKRLLLIVLVLAELHFRFDAVQIAKIVQIDIVKAKILKRNIRISISSYKKQEDRNPPASLTPRTWDMGGETPAANLTVH